MSDLIAKAAAAMDTAGYAYIHEHERDVRIGKLDGAMHVGWGDIPSAVFVRATLESLMEPTDAMLDAAIAPYRHGNTEQFNGIMRETVRGYWQAMLRELMK